MRAAREDGRAHTAAQRGRESANSSAERTGERKQQHRDACPGRGFERAVPSGHWNTFQMKASERTMTPQGSIHTVYHREFKHTTEGTCDRISSVLSSK